MVAPVEDIQVINMLETKSLDTEEKSNWFEYPIEAFPHHTDYGAMVWHGAYLPWLEEARVKCLSSVGFAFADFVNAGVDMPVVEIKSLKYKQPLRMGQKAVIKTRATFEKPRIWWEYVIESESKGIISQHLTCFLALAAIDRDTGRIMRKLPPSIEAALEKLFSQFL
jgi:acyl-CoA thioester hydrolase